MKGIGAPLSTSALASTSALLSTSAMLATGVLLTSAGITGCRGGAQVTLGHSEPSAMGGQPPSPASQLPLVFGEVEQVFELSTTGKDDNPTLSGDQLIVCFTSERENGTGNVDIWCSERSDLDQEFSPPTEPAGINSDGFESSVALSQDGLTIWFGSNRDGGLGGVDIWSSGRASRETEFSVPTPEGALNSEFDDIPRPLGAYGSLMPMGSRRQDDVYWTYFSPRATDGTFGPPELVDELAFEGKVVSDGHLSEDGLLILFVMDPEGDDKGDIFAAERSSLDEDFGPPVLVAGVNEDSNDRDPWLSPDGTILYFSSDRGGDANIYRARLR